ncbi:MAG: hypothetical protein JSW50_14675 [Candidatus Latescibacterota bacterium]|nr:MAG: hypothetical protein JSW50_14675 [Candidatus Latescibacterota bacterium]
MRKLVLMICVLGVVAALGSCGQKDEAEPETAAVTEKPPTDQTSGEYDRPGHWPKGRDFGKLQGSALDTLRVKKKRFDITRDEYWETRGGVLANDYFEVWYPPGRMTVTHGMYVFEELMPARGKLQALLGTAPEELLVIKASYSLEAYKKSTGRDWWYYSVIKGDSMVMSPVFILERRGISHIAVPHEYYQWAIRKITREAAPRWLEEGMASYLSGEEKILIDQAYEFKSGEISMSPSRVEQILEHEPARRESRLAYYHSYRMVVKLIETYGEDKLKQAILLMGEGHTTADAFAEAYGIDYDDLLKVASDYEIDLTKKEG